MRKEAASPRAEVAAEARPPAAEACTAAATEAECTTAAEAAAAGSRDRQEVVETQAAASRLPPGRRTEGRAVFQAVEVAASPRPSYRVGSEAAEDSRSLASLLQFEVG